MQLNRLRELQFDTIYCSIRGISGRLILTHDDLITFLQPSNDGEINRLAGRTGIDAARVLEFLLSDYRVALSNWHNDYDTNSITNALFRSFSHDHANVLKACDSAYGSLFARSANLKALKDALDGALRAYEVVYLPTYRRVELALTDDSEDRKRHGRTKPKLNLTSSGLHTAEIQFGLGDISDRLSQLNTSVITRSNREYRAISENIINELIGGYEVPDDAAIPDPEELKLFFSRLESSRMVIGPQYSRISAPDFAKIYSSDGVPPESAKFLRYFLNKLYGILNITKEIEQPVGDFIKSCNKYLSAAEPSTRSPNEADHRGLLEIDAKALKLNPRNLSVHVESLPAREPISLDALSSGEKQMVSLFARMHLYPKKKIVLIDEPELSLSIDWQRGILIDVLLSPSCEQVIAITHSPFVFDNSLEPYAKTLGLSLNHQDQAGEEAFSWNQDENGQEGDLR